jgi:8-oxo-dGTP pyrophosphatase MutT (NUDIX family)
MPGSIRRLAARVSPRRRLAARFQVGALPYRRGADGAIEVLLVTTRGTGRWMVPKGWPMIGKTHAEAAAQEAMEEAGVVGSAEPLELGRFDHLKTSPRAPSIRCTIAVFPMPVQEELEMWPEFGQRTRRWFSVEEAARVVDSTSLAGIIASIERQTA